MKTSTKLSWTIAGFVAGIAFLVVVCPLVAIWALNTLFPGLAIPYTFWTWLAVIVLFGAVRGRAGKDAKP